VGRRRRYTHVTYSGPVVDPAGPAHYEQQPPQPSTMRRWLHRHRWHLVPVKVGAGAYALAGLADVWPAGGYTTLAAASAVSLGLLQRVSPAERVYGRLVVAGTATWIALADLAGPWTIGSASLWAAGVVTAGSPWWRSHRVRGRIRVDELVEAWPDWTARAQMPGVRIVSAEAGRVYDRLRLELQRGRQTARQVVEALERYASVRGIPTWRLRVDQQITTTDPGLVDLLVTHTDPWRDQQGRPIELPHPSTTDLDAWCQPASICDPIPYGITADGQPATLRLRGDQGGRLIAIASKKGGGKTVTLHNLLAGLTRMVDADIAVIDCKEGGKASLPWAPRLIRRATTPAEAIALLGWAEVENGRRGAESPDPILRPTPQRRALVVVVDEYGALTLADGRAGDLVERLARTIRSASGALILADQRPDSSTWSGALRGQIDEVIVGRLENMRDVRGILPSVEGVDVTEFELPGQMVQQAGKRGRQVEVRTYYLEDRVDIAAIVHGCRDRWPQEQVTANTSRSTPDLEQTLELPRGMRAEDVRAKIKSELGAIAAAHAELKNVPDVPIDEMRRRGQATPPPEPTPEERSLDERIYEAIRSAPEGGLAMGDLEAALPGVPRSTLQVRCAALRRQGRVYTDPPKGRYARWHVTQRDQPAMSNA